MQNAQFEREVLKLTNDFRQKNGLKPLVIDQNLEKAADQHTQDMAKQDFFSHTGKNGSSPSNRAKNSGYESTFVGENIAAGYRTPKQVVDGWIASPGHRANMLNTNYNEIGIGYYNLQNDTGSVNYNNYWTQVFGKGTIETPKATPKTESKPVNTPDSASRSPATPAKPKPRETPIPVSNGSAPVRDRNNIAPPSNSDVPTPKPNSSPNRNSDVPTPKTGGLTLTGTNTADRLIGSIHNDRLQGLGGNDKLQGRAGHDQLRGGRGRDRLSGGAGNDRLQGGQGNDKLRGMTGNNTLTGNGGRDIFVLYRGDGQATITDFQNGKDRIRLGNNMKLGNITIQQQGKDTILQTGTDLIGVLKNVDATNITSDSFI